ncbi:MAG TPA: nitrite/sulfite reductase [Rhodocyclaceae bacterium]|jgi:sulfite reductase (NADPH) hemoprotein beta-component|nr:nitrite/sulfite reductase [Rhodocyclaceae bacterium]
MYRYDHYDQAIVDDRVKQFRDQTQRYLAGTLSEDEYRPLRLQNGLYVQRYAPMLRIAIPYGMLSSRQLRKLADIAAKYDRGYGHVSTRQNLQLNWPKLEDVPEILAELASVEMHAIQTSGNCIRNVTSDQFAGVAPDEVTDPRPWCEILRQWSTFHPEFAYLPRKFKIAVNASNTDRAATRVHDIGLDVLKNERGEIGFRVMVGGGLGRTPIVGVVINDFLPWQHLITYLECILRVYNLHGRRDNKYKARIKILVKALGIEEFRRQVEAEWAYVKDGAATLTETEVERIKTHFTDPAWKTLEDESLQSIAAKVNDKAFSRWLERNVTSHKKPGYAAVTLSLKDPKVAPGDITSAQMHFVADLADKYSFGELRTSHEQNLILADVEKSRLFELWQEAKAHSLTTPTVGLLNDIICCPGGDFCSLANAKSIPIATAIQERFDDLDYLHDIGELDLNISGCMNACGHHHVGNIGILGVDKSGSEWYQVSIGGRQGFNAYLGDVIGPSFAAAEIPDVIEKLIETYIDNREGDQERFVDTVHRIGVAPFKERVYAKKNAGKEKVAANA